MWGAGALNDVKSEEEESREKGGEPEQGGLAGEIEALEADSDRRPGGSEGDLAPALDAEGEAQTHALSIATEGGPVVAEIELQPLAIRPVLLPSAQKSSAVQPAAGFWGRYRLFILTVIAPMLIGSLYLFAVAAPRYASSASFIVRAVPPSAPLMAGIGQLAGMGQVGGIGQASGNGQPSGIGPPSGNGQMPGGAGQVTGSGGGTMGAAGSSIAQDETYAVNAYLNSRDIVNQLSKNNDLRRILSRPEGDFLFRYPTFWLPDDNEFLFQRFQWMVSAKVNAITSISTIEVNAFTPDDAQALATAMLEYAEGLVNQMNQRRYDTGLATANRFVADAQKEIDAIEAELKAYRSVSGSVDPQAVWQSKLQVIEGLSTQLAQIQATIAQQTALAPTSPSLASLRAQAQSYRHEIEKRKLEIAGSSGSEADKLATYEELTTARDIAAMVLSLAVGERDQARQDAERQHLFIQVISRPNLARGYARYPRAPLDLLALLAICLIAFQLLRKAGEFGSERGPPS